MNDTIKKQLSHKTIRKFQDKKVDEKTLNQLLEVFNHSPSSMGMQKASIIRITDKEIREELSKIANQDYMKDCPELFLFIVDIFRNYKIGKENGYESDSHESMEKFAQGFTDAIIGAQNMVVALESLGLGAVYFGSMLNNYKRLCQMLKLPKYTFPVIGLGFGYPAEEPQLKPKMPMKFKIFENKYEIFDNYTKTIAEYDNEMTNYYDTRDNGRRSDSFSRQVISKLAIKAKDDNRLVDALKMQGFKID